MQEIINAVVIDDEENELLEITKAFAQKGISTVPIHYTSPTKAYEKCGLAAQALPRIIITDIQMNTGGVQPSRTDLGNVAKCLIKILEKTHGPYVILAWSSVSEAFTQLKEYVENALQHKKIRLPTYFGSINKTDCKTAGVYSSDLILEKFSEHLDSLKQIKALMHWERSVLRAASSSVNELTNEDDSPIGQTINALAQQVAGANLKGNEAIAINEALVYVLKDRLSYLALDSKSKLVWQEALEGIPQSVLSDERKASLNNLLHFDEAVDNNIICPGDVWVINQEEKFLKLITMPRNTKSIIGHFRQEFYKNSQVTDDKLICIEISPACDFANNKRLTKQIALGLLIPFSASQNSTILKKIKGQKETILYVHVRISDMNYILCISKNYIISMDQSKILNLESTRTPIITKKVRMRENMLLSWIQSIAAHNSRIGTVSFH